MPPFDGKLPTTSVPPAMDDSAHTTDGCAAAAGALNACSTACHACAISPSAYNAYQMTCPFVPAGNEGSSLYQLYV